MMMCWRLWTTNKSCLVINDWYLYHVKILVSKQLGLFKILNPKHHVFWTKMFDNVVQKPAVEIQPPEVFHKKGVLKNFAKFTRRHLCQMRPATLLNKRLWHSCFPMNFAKFLRTPFYRIPPDDCFLALQKATIPIRS